MKHNHLHIALLAGSAHMALVPTAFAQDGAEVSDLMLEEITVTARKKDESYIKVPVSITALDAAAIEKSNVRDIRDFVLLAPSLNYNAAASIGGGGRVNPNTTFRGMQNGTPVPQEQVGSTFVDGIFVTGGPQAISSVDVERIEVLKGPQSVYFGRSTFGGAINFITKTPGNEMQGEVNVDIATYNSHRASVALEGPLINDKLFYRISGSSYGKGAMYHSSTDGGDLGRESTQSGALTLYATPSDRTEFKFRISYQEDGDSSAAISILSGTQAACNGFSFETDAGTISTPAGLSYFCGQTVPSLGDLGEDVLSANTSLDNIYTPNGQTLREVFVDNSLGDPFIGGDFPTLDRFGLKREALRLSLQGSHEFSNDITMDGSIAYNDSVAAAIIDIDGNGSPDSFGYVPIRFEDFSAEFRLRGPQDNKFRWLLGANYYDGEICCEFTGSTRNIYFIGFGPGSNGRQSNLETIGVFGSLEYDVSDKLTLTLEGRYQEDENEAVRSGTKTTFTDFIPRAILSWSPSADTSVYASYSVGVLPGQINTNFIGRPDFQQEQIRQQVGDVSDIVDSDRLDNYEIGLKHKFWGGRGRLALTVYYAEWSRKKVSQNIQVSDVPGGALAPANSVVIEGDQELYGIEFESSVLLSENWQLNGSLAYNKTNYTKFFNGALQNVFNAQDFAGNSEPQNPEWSGHADITYSADLSNDWSWYSRVSGAYKGKTYLSAANIAELNDYVNVNTSIGFEKDGLKIELYVRNLFDQKNWVSGGNIVEIGGLPNGLGDLISGRFQGALVQAPDKRQFGLRAGYAF